jgi:hypothetical protein
MNRRNKFGTALVGLAVLLFVLPALFPVQAVLVHDARPSTDATESQLEARGATVIDYGNLSERGQALYVATLDSPGEYTVPDGQGAPEFTYTVDTAAIQGDREFAPNVVVIDRQGAEGLPPANEYGQRAQDGRTTDDRREIQRYDMLVTRTGQPPLGSTGQLLRLGSVLLAVVALGTGGYLLSSRR